MRFISNEGQRPSSTERTLIRSEGGASTSQLSSGSIVSITKKGSAGGSVSSAPPASTEQEFFPELVFVVKKVEKCDFESGFYQKVGKSFMEAFKNSKLRTNVYFY